MEPEFFYLLMAASAATFYFWGRSTYVFAVRMSFIFDKTLWLDAYHRLPSYWAMVFNPKYLLLWTKPQWEQWELKQWLHGGVE